MNLSRQNSKTSNKPTESQIPKMHNKNNKLNLSGISETIKTDLNKSKNEIIILENTDQVKNDIPDFFNVDFMNSQMNSVNPETVIHEVFRTSALPPPNYPGFNLENSASRRSIEPRNSIGHFCTSRIVRQDSYNENQFNFFDFNPSSLRSARSFKFGISINEDDNKDADKNIKSQINAEAMLQKRIDTIISKKANSQVDLKNRKLEITRKNKLKGLFEILKKLFSNQLNLLNDIKNLTETELFIFRQIVQKKTETKFKNKDELMKPDSQAKILDSFQNVSSKRKEEKCKFIYKHVLKVLMRRFEKEQNIPIDENTKFYEYYFSGATKLSKNNISSFWDLNKNLKRF